MYHDHAKFFFFFYCGFQEQSKRGFWAQIGVKMNSFRTRGVFFKNWDPSLSFKNNDVTIYKVSKISL